MPRLCHAVKGSDRSDDHDGWLCVGPLTPGRRFFSFVAQALLSSHFSQLGAPLATLDPKLWRGFPYILLRSAKGVCHTPLTHTSHTSHAAHSTRGAQVLLVESAQDDGQHTCPWCLTAASQRRASRSRTTTGRIFIDAMADTCSRAIHVHAKTPFGWCAVHTHAATRFTSTSHPSALSHKRV